MLKQGMSFSCATEVVESLCADAMGSGDMMVYATPAMVALMESAAAGCVAPALEQGMTTVGTEVAVSHLRATPIGVVVEAVALLVSIDGRQLSFDVTASDANGVVGKGTHKRFIVERAKFLAKLG